MNRTKKLLVLILILTVTILALLSCRAVPFLESLTSAANDSTPTNTIAASLSTEDIVITPTFPREASSASQPVTLDQEVRENNLIEIYERINPGVVSVLVRTQSGRSEGSGFVIDEEGHIVTNYHVVEDGEHLEVGFPSGLRAWGEVVGVDIDSDLAVIKVNVEPEALHPIPLGDSSQMNIGQTVVAIGNPFRLSGTMTVGIISGQGRTLDSLRTSPEGGIFTAGDLIQTDAAINPGNSGGPLVNLNGEVIGVNRAIRTFNFTEQADPLNSGIGFAIPSNIVKRVAPALIAEGYFDYPYLGISTSRDEITLLDQQELGLSHYTGAFVTSVVPGSPADLAGLRGMQDLIIAVDGIPVREFSELLSYLFNYKSPGDTMVFTVLRGERELEIEIVLGKRP
ncbi:MAG: trypsin-like peptidase domain-containing protein [Anaerolineales bacterium]|nr:trypsin-like peptidase domain-containing protein [Anaerolineales bacterium]